MVQLIDPIKSDVIITAYILLIPPLYSMFLTQINQRAFQARFHAWTPS